MRLLADICRCWDDDCALRERCLRWTERHTGGPRTPNADTLRECRTDKPCEFRIPLRRQPEADQ